MDIEEAFEFILELARQNVISGEFMPEERERQLEAICLIEEYIAAKWTG